MKILICDDHPIVLVGLKKILQTLQGVDLIVEAGDGHSALLLLKSEVFDILILDISLHGRTDLEVLGLVKLKWPSTKVLIKSMHNETQHAFHAFKMGASGYITNDVDPDELLRAVKRVAEGEKYISHNLAGKLADDFCGGKGSQKHNKLSNREFEIMIKLANGKSLIAIGKELFLSPKTVSTYRSRILDKMELNSNTDIARYCIEKKLI